MIFYINLITRIIFYIPTIFLRLLILLLYMCYNNNNNNNINERVQMAYRNT